MREILNFHIGQCGSQIGHSFWQHQKQQHQLDLQGTLKTQPHQNMDTFFKQTQKGKFIPRALFLDFDSRVSDKIQSGLSGRFFSPENFFIHNSNTMNLFPQAMYTQRSQFKQTILEYLQKQMQKQDNIQYYLITNSMGGGVGSGLAALVTNILDQNYRPNLVCPFSVFPSQNFSCSVIEPYNTVLGFQWIYEYSDGFTPIDNFSMNNICQRAEYRSSPKVEDINRLISQGMSFLTAGNRCSGNLNYNIRKILTNIIPFPRLHVLNMSVAPLRPRNDPLIYNLSILNNQIFDPDNLFSGADVQQNACYTGCVLYRGNFQSYQLQSQVSNILRKKNSSYVNWIPNRYMIGHTQKPMKGQQISGSFLVNSATTIKILESVLKKFQIMYRKKAYMHWYMREGMDEMEFREVQSFMTDVIEEYQTHNALDHIGSDEDEDTEELF